ncbi:uncharacterized protein ACB057_013114 [Neosynchiropus ocellatus]
MEDTGDDIAVIGIGCNFPGGEGLENFWKVLLEGRNCAVDIPADRFHVASWFDPDEGKPGKTQTTRAALIDGFNEFDHKFFGISEAESDFMDPQQKLLLQCCFRALEDAGVPLEDISGTRTGVYIGLMNKDYEMIRSNCPTTMNHYSGTGTAMSVAANRISFTFNLTGPSFAIDSACSSSLVALHVARQAIAQGEPSRIPESSAFILIGQTSSGDCDMALCGGVSCIIEPRVFVALSKAKMISPDGTSKPFSDKADGYGRGEGCGVVLLKPLEKAKQDGNKIWGVISKTAINQDGHSVSPITKPSGTQQEELLRGIYTDTDLANVQYIEAHGTGTPIGDLTEATSLSNVIAKTRPPASEALLIGSVKGNIGHTESAAGVAGLIKVLLMMKHQMFVSSALYSQGASSIDPKSFGLDVLSKAERWNTSGSSRRVAGINSFGFGGTNAHAVVREFRQVEAPQTRPEIRPNLFVLSAASEKSLVKSISDTSRRLSDCRTSDLEALCFTSACARSHQKHKYRKAFLVSTDSDLQDHLKSELNCTSAVGNTEVVFVFSGNGVAYRGMCRQLFKEFSVFREKVKEVETLFRKHRRIDISEMFDASEGDLGNPGVVQPLLFAIQVAIVALLKEWGVAPAVVLGHSLGEVAAAHSSGLLSLADAVKVVHHRSALQSTVTGGKMLVVGNVAVAKVVEVLEEFSWKICVAAFNSPQSCTLSGEPDAVDAIQATLKESFAGEHIFLCDLSVPAAYHSHLMDPVMDGIRSRIQRLDVHNKHCKLFSTVSGAEGLDEDFVTGEYWARNVREPVLFEQMNIQETLGREALVLPSVLPERELETVLTTVGKLFELGVNVCWRKLYRDRKTLRTDFPVYHFDNTKKRLFFEAIRRGDEPTLRCQHSLLSQTKGESSEYVCNLSSQDLLYLQEHKCDRVSIVPGAFYVELAFSSLLAHLKTKASSLQLSLSFRNLLTISSNNQLLKVTLSESDSTFKIQSSVATHAAGTYRQAEPPPLFEESDIAINVVMRRCKVTIRKREIYHILSQAGFHYGSVFKRLEDVHYGHELKEAVATISVPCELVPQSYSIHPVLLDCFLQMSAVVASGCLTAKPGFPSQIGSIIVSGPLHQEMVLYLRSARETPDFLEVCGCFATKDGKVVVELRDVRISFLGESNVDSLFFHNDVVPVLNETTSSSKLKALVFEDSLGIAGALKPWLHRESKFTASPYIAKQLTAVPSGEIQNVVPDNSVQVQLTKVCAHSSDYFAITLSQDAQINDGIPRDVVVLRSSFMTPTDDTFLPKTDFLRVHMLDVANILQPANLSAQNGKVFDWISTLGFDELTLPLKTETFQVTNAAGAQINPESYFTTKTLRQVVLDQRAAGCLASDIPFLRQPSRLFKKNCVYMVTGGLTGLGLETVKFIAHNGGGCIVTLSRRSLTDDMQLEMELLQKRCNVKIANLRCDVSVCSQVTESILKVEQVFQSCPIKGVFHSAAVLHDGLLENLDEALFHKVLRPKVGGALNLHFATLHKKLDFFVCYSSISSFIGNASQCNYAAANSFLDMFCHYRRNLGLAGQSINWGPLNLGLLLNQDHFQRFLETKGMMVMDLCEIHDGLKKCLLLNRPQQVICKFNFKNLNRHVLSQNGSLRERLSTLVEAELKDQPTEEPGTSEVSSIHDCVRRIVSNVTNISVDELEDDSTLCVLGIDSMLAMTLQNKVFQETGVNVPLVRILDPISTTGTLVGFLENSK